MPNLNDKIEGFVIGSDLDVERTITSIPEGQTLTKAWLTVKARLSDEDEDALVQKIITPSATPEGQITDTGEEGGTGVVLFHLLPADTEALGAGVHYFDIKVLTSAGKGGAPFLGVIRGEQGVTRATS